LARFLSFPLSSFPDSKPETENQFSDVPEQDSGLKTHDHKKKSGPEGRLIAVYRFQFPVSRREKEGFSVPGLQFPVCSNEQGLSQKQVSKDLTKKWADIKPDLEYLAKYLSKTYLVKAIKILSESRKARFLRNKKPKYGSMNKAFTDQELELFLSVIDDPKFHLLFSFQAIMGLRIGEAVSVNIKDINLRTRELRIFTEKSKRTDFLLIPLNLFDRVIHYINTYEDEIAKAKGFLFFSFVKGNRKQDTENHLNTETARAYFQKYIKKVKLDTIYGYAASGNPKALHRLSTHYLRHYAITNFCEKNELYESIERAQDNKVLNKIRKIQEKVDHF
jgi:integrase